ncbi:hypothetical protein CYLTODRAFT_392861 [Cylindrobasidium torrendii FP15055 ss-10]|uniref:Phospholipase/carboxylesterase/thioesterase domain-containing protein n=1 Tax=Cylindrobasidium torrendii FP15055 ss-10 TaxID=1314674 RepID=A0A0D7BI68_9AGAR|nr:hypothetical protein CYLTODRAFT_392861 [Cylindrobasidium torrendii FP15055 ss-10]
MSDFHLREAPQFATPRQKRTPSFKDLPLPFSYSPSDDGTDENLLILLHGLGDSHTPFYKLGCSFKLPQTAVLSVRAPEQIPYLYEQAFQWYESFDPLGELIPNPNPTPALDVLTVLFAKLTDDFGWPATRIHFFGFAQGGTVALELALKWHRARPSEPFASVVSVSGPLISFPTLDKRCSTSVLIMHRPPPAEPSMPKDAITTLSKGFSAVSDKKLSGKRNGMPAAREEWMPIMRFWSTHLAKRQESGLYEVLSGTAPVPTP